MFFSLVNSEIASALAAAPAIPYNAVKLPAVPPIAAPLGPPTKNPALAPAQPPETIDIKE